MNELYSLENWDKLLRFHVALKRKKRQSSKQLLIDKCNWFFHKIIIDTISKTKDNSQYAYWVNIHSNEIKKYLGERDYVDIKNLLIADLNLIEENENYSSNRFTKSYRLSLKALKYKRILTPILSKQFKRTIDNNLSEQFKEISQNLIINKLYKNLARIKILDERIWWSIGIMPDSEIEENENGEVHVVFKEPHNALREDRYELFFREFRQLNKAYSEYEVFNSAINFKPVISKTGRIYYLGSSIPKLIREIMRTKDNELLYEVDMSSAQPSILFLCWLKFIKNSTQYHSFKDESALLLSLVKNGQIYKYIQQNSEYCKNMNYSRFKTSILTTLNAKDFPSDLNLELKKLFPGFMKWISNIKREKGYKEISALGQSTEAKIFVDTYSELDSNIFALLIHDCILTTESYTHEIKARLIKRVKHLFKEVISDSEDLDRLFKIDLVSIKDEDTSEYQMKLLHESYPQTL